MTLALPFAKLILTDEINENINDQLNKIVNSCDLSQMDIGIPYHKVEMPVSGQYQIRHMKMIYEDIAKLSINLFVDYQHHSQFLFKSRFTIKEYGLRLVNLGFVFENGLWRSVRKPELTDVKTNLVLYNLYRIMLNKMALKTDNELNEEKERRRLELNGNWENIETSRENEISEICFGDVRDDPVTDIGDDLCSLNESMNVYSEDVVTMECASDYGSAQGQENNYIGEDCGDSDFESTIEDSRRDLIEGAKPDNKDESRNGVEVIVTQCSFCDKPMSLGDIHCTLCDATIEEIRREINKRDESVEKEQNKATVGASERKEIINRDRFKKWKCGKCGLLNEYSCDICEACDDLYEYGTWTCRGCMGDIACDVEECRRCGVSIMKKVVRFGDVLGVVPAGKKDHVSQKTGNYGNLMGENAVFDRTKEGEYVDKWKCGGCELLNDFELSVCGACSRLFKDGSWVCRRCKKGNKCDIGECISCKYKNDKINNLMKDDKSGGLGGVISEDQWKCGKCQLRQSYKHIDCEGCGCSRLDMGLWQCPQCTLVNKCDCERCVVCHSWSKYLPVKYCMDCKKTRIVGTEVRCYVCMRKMDWRCRYKSCGIMNKGAELYCSKCGLWRDNPFGRGVECKRKTNSGMEKVWVCHKCDGVNSGYSSKCSALWGCKETRYPRKICDSCCTFYDGTSNYCYKCCQILP